MASTDISIPASRIAQSIHMTITVRGMNMLRWRMTVGGWMIGIAARIMGVGSVEVETKGR
jgi:hypothetical protein